MKMHTQDTIHSFFEEQAAHTPHKIAVLCAGQAITYSELNKKANQLAHYLQKIGATPDSQIALSMDRSIDLLITIFAILKAGCAYVPLDLSHPEERLLFTLKDNDNPILIIKSSLKEKFFKYQGTIVLVDKDKAVIDKQETYNPRATALAQNLAYVIYTSGSTGKPKGVLIDHSNVLNYCQWFADYCQCRPYQRIDFSSNYIFDMAITTSVVPLTLGLTVVICSDEIKKNAKTYLKYLADNHINITKMTPSYFKLLIHEAKKHPNPLPQLENITLGGENLTSSDCRAWLNIYPKHTLYNEYGPTETTVAVSQYKITYKTLDSLELNVPIGTPGTNMSCYIVGPDKELLPDGEIGELYIGGAGLARGYLNHPELSNNYFTRLPFCNERLYKTGDLCLWNQGVLEFIGRIDYQVKIRGFRVDPGEIEKHLLAHRAIQQAVVVVKEEKDEKRLVAYFIQKDKTTLGAKQLREYLKIFLPDYMLPSAYIRVDVFPLTANGKLDREALPIPQYNASQDYLAPSTEMEKSLIEIWSKELNIKTIGVADDFFELGGHSLAAARIISEINTIHGKELTLSHFYKAPTIANLAEFVHLAKTATELNDLDNRESESLKVMPLSDFQFILWLSNLFEAKARKLNIIKRKQFEGHLDHKALTFAFNAVLKKHEILQFHVSKFKPEQVLQHSLIFQVKEIELKNLPQEEQELALVKSVTELACFYPWPKNKPLLQATLFYLDDKTCELQIALPHIISDDISPDILLDDLSKFYLLYAIPYNKNDLNPDIQFKNYVLKEQYYFKNHMDKDLIFWQGYLQDTFLFKFPQDQVIKGRKPRDFSYSTSFEIPQKKINSLHQFCAKNHISINNGLCAAVALALTNCCHYHNQDLSYFFMNIVKSTRDNPIYDSTIGCFLRLEPLKVSLGKNLCLSTLAKQIHQAEIETSLYQRCSNIIKLANIGSFQKNTRLKSFISKILGFIYTIVLPTSKLDRKIIKLSSRLISLRLSNNFLISVNVQNDFIELVKNPKKSTLFGLKLKKIKKYPFDLLTIDNFFDVCFQYNASQNTHNLIISANLKPEFRELIAKEVVRLIGSETQSCNNP